MKPENCLSRDAPLPELELDIGLNLCSKQTFVCYVCTLSAFRHLSICAQSRNGTPSLYNPNIFQVRLNRHFWASQFHSGPYLCSRARQGSRASSFANKTTLVTTSARRFRYHQYANSTVFMNKQQNGSVFPINNRKKVLTYPFLYFPQIVEQTILFRALNAVPQQTLFIFKGGISKKKLPSENWI